MSLAAALRLAPILALLAPCPRPAEGRGRSPLTDARRCRRDADCQPAPTDPCSCPGCGPSLVSYNRRYVERMRRRYTTVDCVSSGPCAACDRRAASLPVRPACIRRRCEVIPASTVLPLRRPSSCRRDKDCVFLPRGACDPCPACRRAWRVVVNRRELRRVQRQRALGGCQVVTCKPCDVAEVGTRAVCHRGRCLPLP